MLEYVTIKNFGAAFKFILKTLHFGYSGHPNFWGLDEKPQFRLILACEYHNHHCVKSVRIRSYSGPYFPAFGLNTLQNNSEYGHFSRSAFWPITSIIFLWTIDFFSTFIKVFWEFTHFGPDCKFLENIDVDYLKKNFSYNTSNLV